ncbi:DUF3465 domain-containing protein [Motiliproteus sp. MSK22-1]|uniref:DUF3465 domain-containing protein n=1 Tax=Motiliproteus sp. MSK22-1 TaxID=1897630 RepID=UPI0009756181|nr:DUF3465 domain-containing protein [Motiliproteus sp. MSK22-1]OMH25711.1 hypothetical protein BGP75_24550 [Motiliproteus sp. MSK22-1]
MKKLFLILILGFVGYSVIDRNPDLISQYTSAPSDTEKLLQFAFENKQSDLQVQGTGTTIKILEDDLKGSRHQRFILKLSTGQTILIAHNIDLAPRIADLSNGDNVEFFGEYEWNKKGGVVHWTHKDPRGKHTDGWLKHRGNIYQ